MESSIAVIGMAGRFPGAETLPQFWRNLINGVETIRFFSQDELTPSYTDPVSFSHPDYIGARGILENIDMFDAGFFNINPREAAVMDPQHRLFLECAWEALEHSGYMPGCSSGTIGVVASSYHNTYLLNNLYSNTSLMTLVGGDVIMHGNAHDHLATHVAYKLNLSGPSLTVQTACSSSLVAVHLACQQLLNGESDVVLAGGVCVNVPEKSGYLYQEGGIFSSDGHCRAFDEKAQGTVFGNGLGIVVLKRVDEALAAGDCIHAVIKGTAINNDGAAKVGYMAPSAEGQAAVITEALAVADVDPETIAYIEAHGTGTAMGDAIEVAALTSAYGHATQKKNFCGIGSIKTNIGHLNAASGVAGLIKTILSLQHKILPPTLNANNPNPNLNIEDSPFYIHSQCTDWVDGKFPRRAGVSSFGVGGTNAHVILEEAPRTQATIESGPQLIILSAKTSTALEEMTANFIRHLEDYPDQTLSDVAFTLQVGRQAFSHRRMIVAQERDVLIQQLANHDKNHVFTQRLSESSSKKIVFMFSGQGSQYVNMASDLYQQQPMFRQHIDYCSEQLIPHLGLDLRTVLYCESQEQIEKSSELLTQTALAQPAIFVIEYALARLWMAWGIEPDYMIGHSIGEYVAACLAGVFELEDALELVALRGQIMQNVPEGSMLAVASSAEKIEPLIIEKPLCVAAINTFTSCVISGECLAINDLQTCLTAEGISHQLLHTSHAFHSCMMDGILKEFGSKLKSLQLQSPQRLYVSNLTGKLITDEEATDPNYWVNHLRHTVLFAKGVESLLMQSPEERALIFLEVGPSNALSTMIRQVVSPMNHHEVISSLRHPKKVEHDLVVLLRALGQLWLHAGTVIHWQMVHDEPSGRVPLPTYPFERSSYWIEPQYSSVIAEKGDQLGKNQNSLEWFYLPSWRQAVLPLNHHLFTEADEWLIFEDCCGVSDSIIEYLLDHQQRVTRVGGGETWSCIDSSTFAIDFQMPEHYEALFDALSKQNRCPKKILYFPTVTMVTKKSEDMTPRVDYSHFHQLLYIAKSLGATFKNAPINLYVLTNNMQEIRGQDLLCPEKATVLGPCRVIGQEYPTVTCSCIDVELPTSSQQSHELTKQLLQEFTSETSDTVVAYRGRYRWIQTFLPWKAQSSTNIEALSLLRKKGVYFITGGLGGIGLTLAEYFAETCQGTIILTSRSEFPERSTWTDWLEQKEESNKVSQIIKKLLQIEAYGATVCVLCADVTEESSMRGAIDHVHQHYGDIHGVVHAAGLAGGGLIQVKTKSVSEEVLNPKIRGAMVLGKVLEGSRLDFLLFCSSINALLNAIGQADYCAANAFLDSYAHYLRATTGVFAVSVNWDTWQEVGMAVNTSVPDALRALRDESLKQGIRPDEAKRVFRYILAAKLPQIILSTQDLTAVMKQHQDVTMAMLDEYSDRNKKTVVSHHRPDLKVAYIAPSNEMECRVAAIWEELLDIKGIGIEDNFFDLGGHSLLASQILARLREAFGVEIPLDVIFDKPTIADMAIIVEDKILEEIEMA
ncbi:MAG: SDR family NAD(P)-dependent oxidoreductase [Gammaproteobacteria bacterium]|nr:SDR family NAD(P)-dependent oxidoreductase [Gammaproteobacteria bacterium]